MVLKSVLASVEKKNLTALSKTKKWTEEQYEQLWVFRTTGTD